MVLQCIHNKITRCSYKTCRCLEQFLANPNKTSFLTGERFSHLRVWTVYVNCVLMIRIPFSSAAVLEDDKRNGKYSSLFLFLNDHYTVGAGCRVLTLCHCTSPSCWVFPARTTLASMLCCHAYETLSVEIVWQQQCFVAPSFVTVPQSHASSPRSYLFHSQAEICWLKIKKVFTHACGILLAAFC